MRAGCCSAVLFVLLGFAARAEVAVLDKIVDVDVPAQALTSAIIELSRQSETQILASSDLVEGLKTLGVRGRMPLSAALRELLQGTSLVFRPAGTNTVGIVRASADSSSAASARTTGDSASAPRAEPRPLDVSSEPVRPEPTPRDEVAAADTSEVVETIPVGARESITDAGGSETTVLDDILVTAGKRVESIRDIAATVNALAGEELERMGAQDIEDYMRRVPGIALNKSFGDFQPPIIRGVATEPASLFTQPTTGAYLDDASLTDPIRSTAGGDINPFDLERVEVLKGPQGTLFGSASLAGAVRYITAKPEFGVWQNRVNLTGTRVSEGGEAPTSAVMLNLPLHEEDLALRVVGLKRNDAGYIDELSRGDKDINELTQEAGRALASWAPAHHSVVTLTWFDQGTEFGDFAYTDQTERLERSNSPTPGHRFVGVEMLGLTADHEAAWSTVSVAVTRLSKASVVDANVDRAFRTDEQSTQHTRLTSDGVSLSNSVELRFASPAGDGPWKWLVGGFYQRYRNDVLQGLTGPATGGGDAGNVMGFLPPGVSAAAGSTTDLYRGDEHHQARDRALFGEVGRTLFGDFELALGTRLYQITRATQGTFGGLVVQTTNQETETRVDDSATEKGVSPKLSLAYRPWSDFNLYGLVSRGFRPGGVQVPVSVLPSTVPLPGAYKSDVLWNYEVGLKSRFFDQSLTFDLALFNLDWKDFQIQLQTSDGINTYIGNIGRAHSRGAELGLGWRAPWQWLEGLSLASASALIDARTDESLKTSNGRVAPAGSRLPLTPRFQTFTSLSYLRPLWVVNVAPVLSHSYIGKSFNKITQDMEVGGYETWDFQIRFSPITAVKRRELALVVNNLTDTRGLVNVAASGSTAEDLDYQLSKPRLLTLNLTVEF